ncbi:MAG: hypothetical protein Kow0074_12810 [Candidatus Zixiibacteriota bacterium]
MLSHNAPCRAKLAVPIFMVLAVCIECGASALAADRSDIVTTYLAEACNCPYQGDLDGSGDINIDDFIAVQNLLIGGGSDVQDPECLTTRADYNADGFVDVVDLYELFDEYLGGNNPPADPCVCGFPCELPHALGVASVAVESKTMEPGTTDTIGVFVSNTTNIYGLVIPLTIRAVSAYPRVISARFVPEGRVDVWMMGTTVLEYDLENGSCGGFGAPGSVGPSSPDAFVFLNTLDSRLPPGADGDTASIEIIVTLPDSAGTFEIDTTCADPGHHFVFFETSQFAKLYPSFQKGVVTIGGCECPHQADLDTDGYLDASDLNAMMDVVYFSMSDPQDPLCPASRTDFNADGYADAQDINDMINHLYFSGPPPIDPCS